MILFSCQHTQQFDGDKAPFVDGYAHCHKCGCQRRVVARSDSWKTRCQDCRYSRYSSGELGASVTASAHMVKTRHTVHRWRLDDEDIVIVHAPDPNQISLLDDPPF